MLTFEIFHLEKVGQGHSMLLEQFRNSMANIKIIFGLVLTVSKILIFEIFKLEVVGQAK